MCGIFGYVGERIDAAQLVLGGLKALEYRGYDSWGIAVNDGGRIAVDRRVGKIGVATTLLPVSTVGLGHTRWATNGAVTENNAHPHLDCSRTLAVVHNGIIANDATLREKLGAAGHRFSSETDTELIAHLVEEAMCTVPASPDRLVLATIAAFRLLRGLNAVAVLDVVSGTIAAAKNGTPLVLGCASSGNFLASDASALLEHTSRVAFVEEGKAALLTSTGARLFDVETGGETALELTTSRWQPQSATKGAHADYISKEMHEQPAMLRALSAATDSVRRLSDAVERSDDVFAIGCGSGAIAAQAAECFFAAAGRRVTAVPASEFARYLPFVKRGTLVVAFSQSGETIDVLDAARAARSRGADIAALTNVEGSSLFRFADLVVPLGAGPERSVVATKTLVAKLALSFMAARALAGELEAAIGSIERAATDIASMLGGERRDAIRAVARAVADRSHLFVIGRGTSHALCLETALKIKELSYVHAEGFAGGELKHGVIALIEPGTPCVVLAPNDGTRDDVMAGAMQVKARGATLIGVSPEPDSAFDHHIAVADLAEATAIVNAVPAQLLGYELAKLRGNDPDMPRNLAKSVTVK
jgi:glucosamine--fructose-6-phosphate aminotransferase (isomerizing)